MKKRVTLEDVKNLAEGIEVSIDSWATTARYKSTIAASTKEVAHIIGVCEKLVEIVESRIPAEKQSCKKDVGSQFKKILGLI